MRGESLDRGALARHLAELQRGERALIGALERLAEREHLSRTLSRMVDSALKKSRARAAMLARWSSASEPGVTGPGPAGGRDLARELQLVLLQLHDLELGWTALADAKPLADVGRSMYAARALREINAEEQNLSPAQHASSDDSLVRSAPREPPLGMIPSMPDIAWVPLVGALLIAAVAITSWLAHTLWLLPSLGPTAYLLAIQPSHPAARPYNVLVGHLVGLGAGFLAVIVLGCREAPGISAHQLLLGRAFASIAAMAVSLFAVLALKASHPPAGATTLLVTLGALKSSADAVHLLIGVAILAAMGELARLLRLGRLPTRLRLRALRPLKLRAAR